MRGARTIRPGGFSLVELMIALLLGAVVTLGITTMFTSNQETYRVVQGQSRLQENARFALDFITRPVRMAGYTGCISSELDVQYAVNDAGANADLSERGPFVSYNARIGTYLEGHDGVNATTWAPPFNTAGLNLPADFLAFDTDDRLATESDILVVRRASEEALGLTAAMVSPSANQINTVAPANAATWGRDEAGNLTYVMISDCDKASVFRVTGVAGNFQISRATQAGAGGNISALTTDGTTFDTDAAVYEIDTTMFFVATRPAAASNYLNNRGEPVLSLWFKEGSNAPVELVEGIEELQVLYGVDDDSAADDDLAPNQYRTINNIDPADLPNVVTVRVTLVANSVDGVRFDQNPPGMLRRTFSRTIALRNRLAE